MAKKTLRAGVVGTGFGRYHMDGYSKLDGVEVAAVCDLNLKEAKQFAQKYGAKDVYKDYREMFSRDDLDMVSIAVPNCLHAPMAIDALNKGKHVLVEKPMTITPKLAKAMVAAAKKNGKRLMVDQAMRFQEETQLLKAYAERGGLGEVYFAKATWTRRKGWPRINFEPGGSMGRGEWFITKDEAGFGALGDIGVHFLDLAWYIMGCPKPVSVTGQLFTKVAVEQLKRNKLPYDIDEFAAGTIRFENGAMITVDVSWDAYQEQRQEVVLFGDKGGAKLFPAKVFKGEDIMEDIDLTTSYGGYDTSMTAYSHFVDCIRNPRKKMIASGEENVSLIQMLDGIARSSESGKEVRIR